MSELIGRRAAIEVIDTHIFYDDYDGMDKIDLINAIRALPSGEKRGRWIDTGSGQECSVCHEIQYGYDNYRYYCSFCGAKMENGI